MLSKLKKSTNGALKFNNDKTTSLYVYEFERQNPTRGKSSFGLTDVQTSVLPSLITNLI